MADKIIEDLDIDFDVRDHYELSPYMFLTESSLFHYTESAYSNVNVTDSSHSPYFYSILHKLENDIFSEKYFGDDKEEIESYHESVKNILQSILNTDNQDYSLEAQFYLPHEVFNDLTYSLEKFVRCLKKKLKRDFRQTPISTARFPHFHQQTNNYFLYNDDADNQNLDESKRVQIDEEKLSKIIDNSENENGSTFPISYEKLEEFLKILSLHIKAFSLSPTFVLSTIKKLNTILESLFLKENEHSSEKVVNDFEFFRKIKQLNDEEKVTKIKYFRLIMMIKMRLYMIIQRLNECLTILLQFILFEQDHLNDEIENDFSFKKFFQESIPDTKPRAKIINNYSSDKILDFSFNNNESNDFILTNEGVFKITDSGYTKIDFKEEENLKIQEMLSKCDKTNAKIAFSNGILYLLSNKDKIIHKVLIPKNEEKENKNHNQQERTNENDKKKSNKKENEKSNKKSKITNKKLREKEKKAKKLLRKTERNIKEDFKQNLESLPISIPDYPIVSIGVYDNYFKILQRKSYNNNKTAFLLTNIDLEPNSRSNFNVIEAFEKDEKESKTFNQIQKEIEIEDKNQKYKLFDACFYKDLIFFSFEDSSFEQWMIYQNGEMQIYKHSNSPFVISPFSKLKIDEDSFLHIIEPIENHENESICVYKMHLQETKYYIRSNTEVFLNHPYLKKLSDIVDNCSHFIIHKKVTNDITTEEYYKIKDKNDDDDDNQKKMEKIPKENQFSFEVTPEEMSCIIQSPSSIADLFESLKSLINEIKDENVKQFFVCLIIKICGINLLYGTCCYYTSKDKMGEGTINRFKKYKTFIFDLLTLIINPTKSINYQIMLRESIVFSLTLIGKFLFLPDCFDELHEFMNKLFYNNDLNSKTILKLLSFFMFSNPSSLYIIDDSYYNQMIEYENEINLHEFFTKSSLFIILEERFSEKVMNNEFIQFIDPYINALFKYIGHLITDESAPLMKIEVIFANLFGNKMNNPYASLMIEKGMVEVAPFLYERIRKEPGVLESDQEFRRLNQDIKQIKVNKKIKVIESKHPYNLELPENENVQKKKSKRHQDEKIIEELGDIDFGSDVDELYCIFDNRCNLYEKDELAIKCKYSRYGSMTFSSLDEFPFNQVLNFDDKQIKIKLSRDTDISKEPFWGYKLTFIGVSYDNPYYWKQNIHLSFFNLFIVYLAQIYQTAYNSTPVSKTEKEFNLILNNKIIQGIKFEDIDNYESNLKQNKDEKNKNLKRTLTRGISRGISYDTDNDSSFDDNFKKSFLNDIITVNENSQTRGKKLLDVLYSKTAKLNRIRLNESTKSILINEHYLAACFFKQLGLINLCLKFINNELLMNNENQNIEIPKCLLSLWKKIYSLRQILFLSYQKSKSNPNSNSNHNSFKLNFTQYSNEIKRKCILLLYSDPILKFKTKGNLDDETIESATKSIFSFVTSEIPLSNISELIDIRRKRLSITYQAMTSLKSFFDKNLLFDSSKFFFAKNYEYFGGLKVFEGVTQKELDDINKLYGSLSYEVIKSLFNEPPLAVIFCHELLVDCLFNHKDDESRIACSKIFIELLEKNKSNNSFAHDYINFLSIMVLLSIAVQDENNELANHIISLLCSDEIDLQSKRLILTVIPTFPELIPKNEKATDMSIALSVLSNNSNWPIVVRSTFCWIASIINSTNSKENISYKDFIYKVLKGIGQSFTGKSCLFINDSFQPFAHRSVAEGMISFIRILFNNQNSILLEIAHEILTTKINKINLDNDDNDDELMEAIGLFASIGQSLSSFEPERKIFVQNRKLCDTIIGYNTSKSKLRKIDTYNRKVKGAYTNMILLHPNKLDLTQQEIENIHHLHEIISNSKYFTDKQNYEIGISQQEISENVLISTFYSFLPVIMQNKNNVSIMMNNENIERSLSLIDFSTNSLPSKENSILILSHCLEQAISSPLYQNKKDIDLKYVDKHNSYRFMKMNFGNVIYNDDKFDLIQSSSKFNNIFICTRPFDSDYETYFEVKINKSRSNQIFIGFIDSTAYKINKAFGFGSSGNLGVFCRKSLYLEKYLSGVGDSVMKREQITNRDDDDEEEEDNENKSKNQEKNGLKIKEGDRIGCYYTHNYTYLVVNGILTPYRLQNVSLNSYVPVIVIDHDEIELEIVQNATIVDLTNDKFDFLNINKLPTDYFDSKDIKLVNQIDNNSNKSGSFHEKDHLIGQQLYIEKTIANTKKSKLETIDVFPHDLLHYRENYGIIKDMTPLNDSRFVTQMRVESFNNFTLSKEIINGIDSRNIKAIKTNFFNLIENRINKKLGFNQTFDMTYLPQKLRKDVNLDLISNYLRAKTIKENSKSIAIIMSRYLTFVLVDYLRFSKSPLLQDEGIESEQAKRIIDAFTISLPTFTTFRPRFVYSVDSKGINRFSIYTDENQENERDRKADRNEYHYILPGFSKQFNVSFKHFLQQTEKCISPKFIIKIFKNSIQKVLNENFLSTEFLYKLIPPAEKIESFDPLPSSFKVKKLFDDSKLRQRRIIGFIPILLSSIPDILPSAVCGNRRIRNSSDEKTFFKFIASDDIKLKWKYDMKKIKKLKGKSINLNPYKNYKLNCGILFLSKDLPENLLIGSLGFIQTLFNIFQVLNESEFLYEKLRNFLSKEFLENIFTLAMKKNPLIYPFLQVIIVAIVSKYGFQDSIFYDNAINASFIFNEANEKLFKMEDFPSSQNELPLLFSIYSDLSKTRISELSINNENIEDLFDKYELINKELLNVSDDEIGKKQQKYTECQILSQTYSWRRRRRRRRRRYNNNNNDNEEQKKKKNYRLFYLIYYYSCLLNNAKNMPYPMFLFVNEWMMQSFGGFQIKISKRDINKFNAVKVDNNKEILYKSKVYENDADLACSCNLTNIYENEYENSDDENESDESEDEDNNNNDNNNNDNNNNDNNNNDNNNNDNNNNDNNNNDNNNNDKNKKNKKKEAYKVFVHQLNDDKQIEIPRNGENVAVSFPLEVLVIHEKGKKNRKNKLRIGDIFVVKFKPSEEQQKQSFMSNYDQIQKDFQQFISLSKFDNELFDAIQHSNESNKKINNERNNNNDNDNNGNNNNNDNNNNNGNNNDNNNNNNNNSNNNNNNNNDNNGNNSNSSENDDGNGEVVGGDKKESNDEYAAYEIQKIPKTPPVSISDLPSSISPRVVSLRCSVISTYGQIIESMMVSYTLSDSDDRKYDDTNWWKDNSSHGESQQSQYMKQIIGPAYSMSTKSKLEFINNILKNEKEERCELNLIFNRFEADKFMSKHENQTNNNNSNSNINETDKKNSVSARPLLVQLMEQVDDESLHLLKVRGSPPFKVNLVGEGAIDGGGPSREIFSSLIVEMMNEQIGLFTYNANRRHKRKDTNQEDLIPNRKNDNVLTEFERLHSNGLTFCGALIAACIVSSLPQPMKLSSIVWDYLTSGEVSIESVYEMDDDFKNFIKTAEDLINRSSTMNESEFKNEFDHVFVIKDSFDKTIDLIQNGSKIQVTKDNLNEFIQLAKKARLHEFDEELNKIKEGFDTIMTYKNITNILHPNELKLLVCGEPNCSVEQMKKLVDLSFPYPEDDKLTDDDFQRMFWNVIESLSVDERMQFIRFSTGNLGLPAPGLKWDENMSVEIMSKEEKEKEGKKLIHSSTCSSSVSIPFFETEEELARMIKLAIKFSGMITDNNNERFEDVSVDFF